MSGSGVRVTQASYGAFEGGWRELECTRGTQSVSNRVGVAAARGNAGAAAGGVRAATATAIRSGATTTITTAASPAPRWSGTASHRCRVPIRRISI